MLTKQIVELLVHKIYSKFHLTYPEHQISYNLMYSFELLLSIIPATANFFYNVNHRVNNRYN